MEGFPDLSSQFAVGAVSVDLRACMWGTPSWGALGGFGLVFQSEQDDIVLGSTIFCTCCIPPFSFLIYTYIFQTGFPRGGFIQGHVDQKYPCTKMHVLVSYIC